nr:MAG TPA: hypothetical protein [Caudoviricetes sp.]
MHKARGARANDAPTRSGKDFLSREEIGKTELTSTADTTGGVAHGHKVRADPRQ